MTRIAVISDIHGNLPALEAVVADAEAQGCTAILNLGDCLSGPLWPAETADYLIARDWPTIAGNHERQLLAPRAGMGASDAFTAGRLSDAHFAWLRALPPELVAHDMRLCHGTPASDIEHFLSTVRPDAFGPATDEEVIERAGGAREAIIWCGHTHIAGVRDLADGRTVANPGSVGLQAFDDDRPYPYVVSNGDPAARYAIVDEGRVSLRAVDYDHASAAAKARSEGFAAWGNWLETGRA